MNTNALTDTGDLVGTLRYMAQERFQGGGDERADIYALGLTLYELLLLRPAFDARDRQPTRGQGGGAVSACCFVQTSRGVSLIIRRSWRERSTAVPLRATPGLHRRNPGHSRSHGSDIR
jgi:serine/threonine protein kinase